MEPFNPQPIEVLKQRFTKALIESYQVSKIIESPKDRPGSKPNHIFDFEDGIRLIISRDIVGSEEVIHFSASIDCEVYAGPADRTLFDKMIDKFFILYGSKTEIHLVGFSDKGIPHFYIKNANSNLN